MRCAFEHPALLKASRIRIDLVKRIVMLDDLRRSRNLLVELRHDVYRAFQCAIFGGRVVVELIGQLGLGLLATAAWLNELVLFEDILASMRIPFKVDLWLVLVL